MDFSIEQIEQYSQINDISLCYGASGICLLLSEIDKEKALSVFNVLKQKTLTLHGNINIRNGLAGIALLVKCLHNKGVFNGKISSVLREIDDTIFRTITNNNGLSQLKIQDAIANQRDGSFGLLWFVAIKELSPTFWSRFNYGAAPMFFLMMLALYRMHTKGTVLLVCFCCNKQAMCQRI